MEAIALRLEAIARHGPESPTSWCAGAGRALGGPRMAYFDPEPWLGQIEDGSKIHIAGRAWYRDSHRAVYHCTTALRGQVFRLAGVDLKGDRFTIFSADKTMEEGTVVLTATNSTTLIHGMIDRTGSTEVIDICSGYGIMTAGYHLIGSKIRCHVEINDRYVDWLRARRQTVIAGDIDSTEVKLALLPYTKDPCIITGGFACQPFSQLGDGRQQYDPRARSFEGMVSACYLYQPVAMILECTKEALHSPWVQDTLHSFCQAAGYTFQQQLCHLHELWPAKRTRWWAVITHPGVQMPKLQCFPALDFQPSFRHLLPKIAEWPSPQIVELALQPHELDAFDNQPGGLGKNAVSPNKPLQTALHAWGSQLQACACGCRAGGFSDKRLEEKGLYGALIPLNGVTNVRGRDIQNMRHIHPDEVAILHLVPTVHIQGERRSLRLDLTALGQMASPAQSIWHLAQVVQALDKVFGVQSIQNMAEQALVGLATEVFAARDLMLAPFVHTKESALFQQAFYDKFGRQSAAISPPVPHIVASVASDPKVTHGGGPKRKADIAHIDPTDSPEGTVVTATGGLEFFANKPNRVCPTKVPVPQVAQDVVQTSTIEAFVCNPPANPVDSTGRGKGKGGRMGPSNLPDLIMIENTRSQAPDELSQNDGADSPQPQDAKVDGCHQAESLSLITDDQFAITVCSKDCAPISIRVHKGATVGQLSQAEEGVSMLVQPIVVTTLTGVPLPLQSVLTPATWYVLADGAKHQIPKCNAVHAEQCVHMTTNTCHRFQALLAQGPLVADDEMAYYAALIRQQGHKVGQPVVIDTPDDPEQQIAEWVLQSMHDHEVSPGCSVFMVPILFMSHWSPIAAHVNQGHCTLFVPQDLDRYIRPLIIESCGVSEISFETFMLPTGFAADCGFQTVNWMFAHAIGNKHPRAVTPAQADQWRTPFARHVLQQNQVTGASIRLGGVLQPDQLLLQSVLKQHGVSQDRLSTCATHLINQLGAEAIAKALASSQTWKDLKTLASQAVPPIRIVLASELDAAVQARLESAKPFGSKANKKPPAKSAKAPVIPSAEQIKLPDSIFMQQDGQKLSAIPLHKVEAHAQGVALCNIQDVAHLLGLTSPISSEGVALLILDHADSRLPAQVEHIRVPAMASTTGEPMLVSAAMLQLGAKRVMRHVPTESFVVEEISTKVLKIVVYRDEWANSWTQFMTHPVKAVFEHPILQVAEFPQAEHILDVWDRQMLDSKLGRAQANQAEVFAFLVRTTEAFAMQLMQNAAVDGIYVEPRTMDGRRPDPAFRVVWMPRLPLAQVRLARSQTEAKTTVVRMGARFGLRVAHEQAEAVHAQHRPDLMFLDGHELRPYKVGPFPYGSTKASISKGLKHIGWNARPVQPMSQMQVQEGIFWQVTAPHEPSHWIYQMKHGDILIAKIDSQKEAPLPNMTNIIASKQTITKLAQTHQDPQTDPWLQADPWQSHATNRKQAAQSIAPAATSGQLAALEQRLEQKINAAKQATHEPQMPADQTARIEALESQVHTLTHSASTFQSQQSKVNHQLANQLQGLEGRIDAKLDEQMQRIEALLSKKQRHE